MGAHSIGNVVLCGRIDNLGGVEEGQFQAFTLVGGLVSMQIVLLRMGLQTRFGCESRLAGLEDLEGVRR